MEKTKTSTGLKVTVDVLHGVYENGKKCAQDFLETMTIKFDDFLPRSNYTAAPQASSGPPSSTPNPAFRAF